MASADVDVVWANDIERRSASSMRLNGGDDHLEFGDVFDVDADQGSFRRYRSALESVHRSLTICARGLCGGSESQSFLQIRQRSGEDGS